MDGAGTSHSEIRYDAELDDPIDSFVAVELVESENVGFLGGLGGCSTDGLRWKSENLDDDAFDLDLDRKKPIPNGFRRCYHKTNRLHAPTQLIAMECARRQWQSTLYE